MTDKELIDEVAKFWVENGGDADGIAFCWAKIKEAVEDILNDR